MMRLLGGCLRRLLVLALLGVCAVVAWQYRYAIGSALRVWMGTADVPSEELAEVAQAKLARLAAGTAGGPVVLREVEVQSLVQYGMAESLPPYIVGPCVSLRDGRVTVDARIPTERFPHLDELTEFIGFLPDTAEVAATGQLIPLPDGRLGFAVDHLSAANIPLPRGLIPSVLQRLGRSPAPGLPPDALALPLPAGAAAAYVRGDSLILIPRRDEA
ncbi:MAG TPA: hypothetical protein VF188_08830 [Longimicrobiales bacterium]